MDIFPHNYVPASEAEAQTLLYTDIVLIKQLNVWMVLKVYVDCRLQNALTDGQIPTQRPKDSRPETGSAFMRYFSSPPSPYIIFYNNINSIVSPFF